MKIIVIGLGSMGKRRIRLIKKMYSEIVIIGVDQQGDRRSEAFRAFGIYCYNDLNTAIEKESPDVAFVCTSPLAHYIVTKECLKAGISVFSEINLINENHEELIGLAKENASRLFLSSTPMYRREMQYITDEIRGQFKKVNYIYHVGQYLPDWHPWESYKSFFVGDIKTNGCRELLCIELPWLIRAFGEIKNFKAEKNKISDLEIDFYDSYFITVTHEGGNMGILCFDVVSRKAIRNICIFGDSIHIEWDGTPDSLYSMNLETKELENIKLYENVEKNSDYCDNIIEDMYVDEITAFFDFLNSNNEPMHTFEKDIQLISIVDEIEEM